jgi:hypothetical protein
LRYQEYDGIDTRAVSAEFGSFKPFLAVQAEPQRMTELRDLGSYVRLPTSDESDDCLTIKIMHDAIQWEVEAEGSWTIQQLKQHVSFPRCPSSS